MAIVEIDYQRDPATGQVTFGTNGNPMIVANSNANTYGQLQQRVQYEVLGSPTTADVQQAIQDAISEYERETFWFNNMRYFGGTPGAASNLQTKPGQEFYSFQDMPALVNYPHVSKIMVFAFNNRYSLVERTPQWIDDVSISPTWQGLPTDWCWQAGGLRLYPIPDNTYPLILDSTIRLGPLNADADYNAWTNRGEWLIRSEAKRLLFTNITRDSQQAQLMEMEIFGNPQTGRQGALTQLRRESTRRAGGAGRIRSSRSYV